MRKKKGPGAGRRPPTVAVVGAGRLGTALARALAECGYEVAALVCRRASSARRAARVVGTNAPALSAAQLSHIPRADLLLLTTPDDALAETAARLSAELKDVARGAVALHASGAVSSEALAPLRVRGFAVASMHPLVSVSDAEAGPRSLRTAFYCLEGDARALRLARRVVRALGGRSFTVPTEKKALYHAAAVMTSGHAVALFDAASRLLARCGLTDAKAREVLLPLSRSTLDNLSAHTPSRALTGTFARADLETVKRHLDALATNDDADADALYKLLGRLSLPLALAAGADAGALEEIARLLATPEEP
jgi:predicted short-subunit dehydrogenase-like oxidoreductase (DUF2520 family)